AVTYAQWAAAAEALDRALGLDSWRDDPVSPEYDHALIQRRLAELRAARAAGDTLRLLFLIRTAMSRNLGDMGNVQLYAHTHIGTKRLIEAYLAECEAALAAVVAGPVRTAAGPVDDATVLDELVRARHAFGRTALLLSGGGTMGMLHIGVIEGLLRQGLLPKVVSGSSAGAIVAASLCVRTDTEIPVFLDGFAELPLEVFEDSAAPDTAWVRIARLLKHGTWIEIRHLAGSMQAILGELTFQEAYNRTRRVLNIPVSSAGPHESGRLLNYLTAPNVLIWSAVCASCSVPLIFASNALLAKDPRTNAPVPWTPTPQRWIDGSVDNDLPMTRLTEMFNVNHFVVSQVNPHVIPFLPKASAAPVPAPPATGWPGPSLAVRAGRTLLTLVHSESMHRLTQLAELNVLPGVALGLRSVLAQKYSGDITILPDVHASDLASILTNPSVDFMTASRLRGNRATWPKIELIRNHCAVELALDRAILEMRA
ncbi:acyl transferase/acyl hydrolase/lysophospholipase, partial [Dipodascopsis tothii]|uniref:acyl transferase/acyl hydrolase/lysophospholipase n=1 Tax=Dipodascopsis tothii TaxID=44089 RepID=UPI0034CF4E3F